MKLELATNKIEEQRIRINTIRDMKEVSPIIIDISTGIHLVDCDERSDTRMSNAILLWDSLGISKIVWTLADNTTIELSKIELEEMQSAVVIARGIRALHLHQYSSSLKDTLPVSDDDPMFEENSWPL